MEAHHRPLTATGRLHRFSLRSFGRLPGPVKRRVVGWLKPSYTHAAMCRVVRPDGNPKAREMIEQVFDVCDREWRGIGTIPGSGYRLREAYAAFYAALESIGLTVEPVGDYFKIVESSSPPYHTPTAAIVMVVIVVPAAASNPNEMAIGVPHSNATIRSRR